MLQRRLIPRFVMRLKPEKCHRGLKERGNLRLSYLIANPSFLSRCEIGQFNIDSSETKIAVECWFSFISDRYIDKKSSNRKFGNKIKGKDIYTIAGSNKHPQTTSNNLTTLSY